MFLDIYIIYFIHKLAHSISPVFSFCVAFWPRHHLVDFSRNGDGLVTRRSQTHTDSESICADGT